MHMSNLVIVESPAKAKTIKKYLGGNYEVIASMGHIRDLPKSKLGVDVDNGFEPVYTDITGKETLIKELKSAAKKSENVYLATDPDREGEAISWHLAQMLGLPVNNVNRIEFNEITKTGITNGMAHPRSIDIDLVNAQQARRILDRIVGYKLSPFLWKKVRRGLSAGRVQSVAVRLIVDRENEIAAFRTEEYWSIDAKLTAPSGRKAFAARLNTISGKKPAIPDKEAADKLLEEIGKEQFIVRDVKKSVKKKSPYPPFTTSTMQQEASKRLGFQASKTMRAAQALYEGVELPDMGAVGLITYMRTDSLRVSEEARADAFEYITGKYGKEYVPSAPQIYKSKSNAQDAHEAIRPTMPSLSPDKVKDSLPVEQYKLYKLIWERFIASQMANAQLDTVSADIDAGKCEFKASGYSIRFDGFMALYSDKDDVSEDEKGLLPELKKADICKVKTVEGNQHFTQPPARFTEASLIKALEENGIGRPSTYAPTISTIINRQYVERDGKLLRPTGLGVVTTELMKEHFKHIVDAKFTASMENSLDQVEVGEKDWVATLGDFYTDFAATLTKAEKAMEGKRVKVPDEETDEICEVCGKPMVIKIGRFGKFLACSGFPDCRNTKKIVTETGALCPLCGKKVLAKKSKKGKKYFGCEDNPNCAFMTWDIPTPDKCPKCGGSLFKKGARSGKVVCLKEGCGYEGTR